MYRKLIGLIFLIPLVSNSEVINTGLGKIDFTEGHQGPNCRTVRFISNETGVTKTFRIKEGDNTDISSVILAAMMAEKNVTIWYDPDVTSGCGTEPRIEYVRVYAN